MNVFLRVCAVSLLVSAASVYAQEDTTLKDNVKSKEVNEELLGPDGATIKFTDDGGFQIFGMGTGTYDFQEPDEIKDATKEATLEAKAALAKFLKERITSDEIVAKASEKKKLLTEKNGKQEATISKEDVKKTMSSISNSADQILRGVIVLETVRVPRSDKNGEVKVKVGYSSKTLQMVEKASAALEKAGRASAGNEAAAGQSPADGQAQKGPTGYENAEKHKANSDF